jgi:SAM-dependent methyltransferase
MKWSVKAGRANKFITPMTRNESIIELGQWLASPAGRYLLRWEQAQLDSELVDLFGYHALQLGLPELDALRANRMPRRWLALDNLVEPENAPLLDERPRPSDDEPTTSLGLDSSLMGEQARNRVALRCDFDALPLPSASVDLLVLPHTLELARDPHLTLREVERVLVPEGRVAIIGFNPASLWALRRRLGRTGRRLGLGDARQFMPRSGEFIGYWRLRDWLRLLSFEVERGRFGCWRPPLQSEQWLWRFDWMERAGDRWWPVLGALYFVVAVKRVRGMRLVGLARREHLKPKAAPAVAAHRQRQRVDIESP